MAFDTKIAVLLRDDLETWQRLNVTAFLVSGIAAYPQLVGEAYADADGTPYLAMLGQPVMVFKGDAAMLRTAHERAVRRGETVASSPATSSAPATTRTTAPPWPPYDATTSTSSGSPCTRRATPSTRSSRARCCIPDRIDVG